MHRFTLLSGVLASLAFGVTPSFAQTGTYQLYGTGCRGSGASAGKVSPSNYANMWGESNNVYPLGWTDQRYMQSHAAADFGAAPIPVRGLAFRTKQGRALTARVIPCTVRVGNSKRADSTLETTYANNWAVAPTTVFSGNLNVAATQTNNSLTAFDTRVPFTTPYIYLPARGALIWEFENKASSRTGLNIYDFVNNTSSATTISRMWASPVTATTGTTRAGQGIVVRVEGATGGAIVNLNNTGVPAINKSFKIGFSGAVANSVAILWLGANKLNISLNPTLPGCTLYTSLDLLVTGVATGTSGSADTTLIIPNNSQFVGVQFYNQWMVIDQAANSLGVVLSNGGEAKVGR